MNANAPHPGAALAREQELINLILDVLRQEQQHLVSADTDALERLTPRKAQLVHEMSGLAVQRHRALGAAGFAAEESGMQAWLDASGDQGAAASWQDLLAKTREAKELNRVNGLLINKRLAHNAALLNAMRDPAAADGGVYGPGGQSSASIGPRRHVIG